MSPRARRFLGHLLGGAATLACLVFLARLIGDRWTDLSEVRWTPELTRAAAGALALYVAGLVLGGIAWYRLLGPDRSHLGGVRAVALLLRTNVAKYLPGNVGHFLGRLALSRRLGVPTRVVLLSLAAESFLTVLATAVIGVVGVLHSREFWWNSLGELTSPGRLAAGAAILTAAALGGWLLWRTPRPPSEEIEQAVAEEPEPVGARVGVPLLLIMLSFNLYGYMVLLLVDGGLGAAVGGGAELAEVDVMRTTVAFALAWVIGLVTPGSPGGLGVRETALVVLLAPMTGADRALVLALGLRVVTVVGDGVGFLLSFAQRLGGRETVGGA